MHCLCVQSESERVFESQRRAWPVLKRDLFNNSDNIKRFFGFCAEDIVLREAVAGSDFDVHEVSSVHTLDWSN